jgi:CDP-diacylglycerol--glycerol-3-phosphate 3-phosphatidyltransferase
VRAVAGPLLLACAFAGSGGAVLAALVFVAFVTDVFDGIVARRLGIATETLRRADTVADASFYVCATATLLLRFPEAVRAHVVGIGALVLLELARLALERAKYGRIAAYHMWSAKAWGIALWLGFSEVFLTGRAGALFESAIVVGILADLEGLAASVLLTKWRHDVPTLWHALEIERASR